MALHIAADQTLPLKFLSLRKVVFGGSGSGKTTLGRVIYEEATAAGVLCGAIDLKGDWWGLKSTSDGKHDGIPVVIFGGEHQDVPLDEQGGASLADIVVELRQPFVLDLEQLSKGKQLRFLASFLERLYDRNREPLVLFCDEADRYAPQKPMSPEANICLGAAEDIAKRGRKHGIFPIFITQRNASMNKGVSELCDVAIVCRTPGPRDQDAVNDWFSTNATREHRDIVMGRLSGMATGTAVICSAHPDLKLFRTIAFRLPKTFDSSATPEIGKRRIEPKRLAQPDIEQLKRRMAATIEKMKVDDPKALRAEVSRLNTELVRARESNKLSAPPSSVKPLEVPIVKDSQVARLNRAVASLGKITDKLDGVRIGAQDAANQAHKVAAEIVDTLRTRLMIPPTTPVSRVEISRRQQSLSTSRVRAVMGNPSTDTQGGIDLDKCQRAILGVLAQHESCPAGQLALLAGYRWTGGFRNALSALRTQGYIEGANTGSMRITSSGLATGPYPALPTGQALRDYWIQHPSFGKCERKILQVLVDAYPNGRTAEQLTRNTGYEWTGGFRNSISILRTAGVLVGRNTEAMVASDVLFESPPR